MKTEINTNPTSKELRQSIIRAKYEIDEWSDFIKMCEKKLKENREKK